MSNPDCTKFISRLISSTASAQNPAEFTDAMKGFEKIGEKGFAYWQPPKDKVPYGTVRGTISSGNAQVLIPFPYPNYSGARGFDESQAQIRAMVALHEILHLAGRNQYSDFDYARTVAAMRGVAPPDFSKMTPDEAVTRASEYWNGALESACKPR